ncbi:hypothetical protein HMPREF2811_02115 [Globicatella sp. HMSC072A10]|uniref:hypothetical protein n=1 Tax=Globicatella sp. HMSC072A10 TaxID=1739315 RepID=UPI0008D381DB|nr:hypothetical protein [Globicatella sp. HMSC072A10]OFK55692.1 hypothetical protein HMPREF2811_02115 [Globicatella sp. HMSC072A10]
MSHHIVNCAVTISTHPLFQGTQSKIGIPSLLLLKQTLEVYSKIIVSELGDSSHLIPVGFLGDSIVKIITAYQQNLIVDSQSYFNELLTFLNQNFPVNFHKLSHHYTLHQPMSLEQLKSNELLMIHEDEPEYIIHQSLLNLIAWFPLTLAATLHFEVEGVDKTIPIVKILLINWFQKQDRLKLYNLQSLERLCLPLNPIAAALVLMRHR